MENNFNIIFLEEYAKQTGGTFYSNEDVSSILETIHDIFTDDSFTANRGEYINAIDLGSRNIVNQISLDDISFLPAGSIVNFRVRYSTDNVSWTVWSGWIDSADSISLPESTSNAYQYIQYQIKLIGNELFESPIVNKGLKVCYYMAGNLVVFFNPIQLDIDPDEYISLVHITDKGVIPDTSTVNYGFCQCNPSIPDPNDYFSNVRPLIESNQSSVILSRSEEVMKTEDYVTYVAVNGRWPSDSSIAIYRDGVFVDSSEYVADSDSGSITFHGEQSHLSALTLFVYFESSFRITMNITNYGTQTAVMEYMSLIYNVSSRLVTV